MSDETKNRPGPGRRLKIILSVCIAVGLAAFFVAAIGGKGLTALRAWQAFLINWFFFTGIASAGVVLAAILEVTNSRWGRPLKRLAESMGAFLPFSFLLFLALLPGMGRLYPWVDAPVPGMQWWLTLEFVFGRDLLAMLALYGVSFMYIYHSVRPDLAGDSMKGAPGQGLRKWLSRGWRGDEEEVARGMEKRRILAPAVIIVYSFVFSLLAYDLIMSLVPTWYSTLFGAYICIVNLFAALAMIAVLSVALGKTIGTDRVMGEVQYHDLGKLTFGFCLLALDFFWSQFLVIWYGNLPEETEFLLIRAYAEPWIAVSWIVLVGGFILPFLLLLRRRMKSEPKKLFGVALWIVAMIWLERFILIAPSVWPGENLPLGILEVLVTAGFAGIFLLALLWFNLRLPPIPISDPLLSEKISGHHVLGEPDYMPGSVRPASIGNDG